MENYYEGYEGYPEIDFFILSDDSREGIQMWDGYFYNIMRKIKPVNGEWTSLAYYFNLNEGWYDESPWKIPSNVAAIEQFETIERSELGEIEAEVLAEILGLLKENRASQVFIDYS